MAIWEHIETAEDLRKTSAMAGNSWFGLQTKKNKNREYWKRWIKNGKNVCDLLQQAGSVINSKNRIDPDNLASFYRFKPARKEIELVFGSISTMIEKVNKINKIFERLWGEINEVNNDKLPSLIDDEIKESQKFFDKVSEAYLKASDCWLQRA